MLNNKPAIDDFTAKKLDDIKDVKIFNSNLKEDLELCDEVIRLMKAIKNTISDKNE
jgi:hypothetical protein